MLLRIMNGIRDPCVWYEAEEAMSWLAVAFDFIHSGGVYRPAMICRMGVGLPESPITERSGVMMGEPGAGGSK